MSGYSKLATIECETCSGWIEVYPQDAPGEPELSWSMLGENVCTCPPLNRCPHARAEVKRRFPEVDL